MTWKKRIISIVLCLCALLCAASVRADAEDAATTHTDHPICGANHKNIGNHTSDNCSTPTWTAWNGTTTINNDFFGSLTEKYLYLSQDVEISNKWTNTIVPEGKTLYLCLNGHSLTRKASGYTINVYGTLVLCDCNGNGSGQGKGAISHGKEEDGSFCGTEGVYVTENATFTMYGGEISKNKRTALDTETITYSAEGGGGVWVKDYKSWSSGQTTLGNFAMYGGKISDNEVQSKIYGGGGVCMDSDGSFYMENGTITGNKCNNSGGGLDIRCETITIKGNSTISGNTCGGDGGGIFAISSAESSITNCTISGNNATGTNSKGGGLAFQNSTFTLEKCTITGNKAQDRGGGIFVLDNTANLTLSSGLNFSGNQDNYPANESGNLATGTANDVFLHTGAYLRLASDFSKTSADPIVVTTYFEPDAYGYKKIAEDNRTTPDPTDFKYGNDSNSTIGIIAKTNNGKVELLACKHNYSTQKDETNHWQECSICGDKKDVTAHQYNQEKAETGCLKTAATCTAKAVYYKSCVCGATDTSAAETFESGEKNPDNHTGTLGSWQSNDDGHWKEYSCCRTKVQEGTHNWNEGEVTTPATCTTPGVKTFTCGTCSAKKTEEIPASGHDFSVRRYDENNHWLKCSRCDATDKKEAHSGGTATCTKKAECEVCGQEHGEKLAHSYTVLVYNETQHWYKCANCDATNTKVDHSGGTASCTKKAECSVCGQEYGGLKAHDFENGPYQYDGQQHWKKCADCDATDTKVDHSGGKASCTEKAKCEVCGQPHGGLKAHDFANGPYQYDGEQHWYKCANCTATTEPVAHTDFTAWKSDRSGHWHECSTCGYKTAVTAHTPDRDKATETEAKVCKDCDWVIAPATHPVHTWVFVAETPATCNAAGEREHYKCTCGRTSFKNGDAYKINEDASVLTIEKNSANHTGAPDSKWLSDSENHWQEYTCCHARANEAAHSGGAATCTAQAVCQVCGKAYGPLAAHDWGAWEVTTPATKDAPGVETRTCTHNSAHTETRSIPKLSTAVYTVSEDTKIAQIEAKVDGLDKILESNENKALVNDGKSVGVSLTVKNTASSGVSEKIKEKLAGSNLVGLRLELTVEKTVTANGVVEPKQTIHDAGVLLKTTITLPAELQGKSGYVVYRLHDGNVHVLTETANENGEFISVSADKTQITICARLYSEYVIAYQTGGSSGGGYHPVNPTPVKATSANTGDAGVLLYGVTAALSLTGTAWLGAKSRKH